MTYSLNAKGAPAANANLPLTLVLSDTQALPAQQAMAMQQGMHFLAKRPDGGQSMYKIDAERSIPGQPPVLVPVGRF